MKKTHQKYWIYYIQLQTFTIHILKTQTIWHVFFLVIPQFVRPWIETMNQNIWRFAWKVYMILAENISSFSFIVYSGFWWGAEGGWIIIISNWPLSPKFRTFQRPHKLPMYSVSWMNKHVFCISFNYLFSTFQKRSHGMMKKLKILQRYSSISFMRMSFHDRAR